MSKLPNAPLIEVIFELRWKVAGKSELQKYEYLIGDLYSSIKDQYPLREPLTPPGLPTGIMVNNPAHRFRTGRSGYPLVQVGPGVLTLNTTDDNYFWDQFYQWAESLIGTFLEVYPGDEFFKPNLLYLDFFEFDYSSGNVLQYINDNFNLEITQGFLQNPGYPFHLDQGFFYETSLGYLTVTLKKGQNSEKKNGIVMQSSLQNQNELNKKEDILGWLDEAHRFSSNLFKEITKGKLYQSFQ